MVVIEYFLPYNNFIVLFCLIIFNFILILRRSYWQTFLIGNLLLFAVLFIIGFDPFQMFFDIISKMFELLNNVLRSFWESLIDLIFPRR